MNILLDTHMHTLASGHAYNTIEEMVSAGVKKGLKLMAITEHAPMMPGSAHQFYFHNLKVLSRKKQGISVLFGAELNVMDSSGKLDLEDWEIAKLDVNIASLHLPCIKPGTREENTRGLIGAMENPYVNILGHCDDSRYELDYEQLVQAAKETHTIIEINNSSLNPEGFRVGAKANDQVVLKYCLDYQVPVVLNSDAHCMEDVGNVSRSLDLIKEMDFPESLVVNDSVEKFIKCLEKKKNRSGFFLF